MDKGFKTVAASRGFQMKDDELFSAVQNNGFFPEKYVRYYSNMPEIHNSVYHATMPVVMVDDITPNPYMSYRIESAGKPVGFATLIQKFRKFRPIDPELFSVFCRAIGNEIRYDIIVADSRKHTYEYLIAELLDKKLDEKKLRERIMQVDLKLRKNLFLMAVERKSEQKNKSYFMEREQRRLEIMIPGSYCTIYRNSLIVLFSCDTDRPFTSKKRKEICSEVETYGFTGGISKKFYDFFTSPKSIPAMY